MIESIQRGTFKIIRSDGSEDLVQGKPTIERIQQAINANTLDIVNLRHDDLIMLVDDSGYESNLPVNEAASALYLKRCKPGTSWQIRGDVVLVNDLDFA